LWKKMVGVSEYDLRKALIRMQEAHYTLGTAAFSQLVSRIIATGIHEVEDSTGILAKKARNRTSLGRQLWRNVQSSRVEEVYRYFEGTALLGYGPL
jgi:hypothetical protein